MKLRTRSRSGHLVWIRPGKALAIAALLLMAAISGLITTCGRDPSPRRVVLITLDTLRLDAFDGEDPHRSRMPLTRQRAEGGLVFERFYAASGSTQPTHATIFTGLHPWEHGVHRNGVRLPQESRTVAEIFGAAGFTTAAVAASFPVSAEFGFEQGFDEYREPFSQSMMWGDWKEFAENPEDDPFFALAEDVVDEAVELLTDLGGTQQFLWFHFFDPHDPYGDRRQGARLDPGSLRNAVHRGVDVEAHIREAREAYDEDVATLDRQLDRLLDVLLADDAYETHIVVTADHGECFGEGGSFGHGTRLLPAVIHVPTFVLSPAAEPGRRTDIAGSIDIGATLLRLAGVDARLPGGRDLLEIPPDVAEAVGMRRTYDSPMRELRADGKTYRIEGPLFFHVTHRGALVGNGSGLAADETTGSATGSDAAQAVARFRSFEQALSASMLEDVEDPEAIRKLRALGYVR